MEKRRRFFIEIDRKFEGKAMQDTRMSEGYARALTLPERINQVIEYDAVLETLTEWGTSFTPGTEHARMFREACGRGNVVTINLAPGKNRTIAVRVVVKNDARRIYLVNITYDLTGMAIEESAQALASMKPKQ